MITKNITLRNERTFMFFLIILFSILSIFVLKNLIFDLIFAGLFAYFLFPIYNFFKKTLRQKNISAILTISTFVFGFVLPLFFLSYYIVLSFLRVFLKNVEEIESFDFLSQAVNYVNENFGSQIISEGVASNFTKEISAYIVKEVYSFVSSIPSLIIDILIILFIMYYIFVSKKRFSFILETYIPLKKEDQVLITKKIKNCINTFFNGYFLTGFIQTLIACFGYFIFGFDNILLIGFATFLLCLLPLLGPPLIWIPLSLFLILNGNIFTGILFILYNLLLVGLVDNFLRPILMSSEDTIPPSFVFVGIFGGLFFLGAVGIILGPLIFAITKILIEYYYYLDTKKSIKN